MYYGTSGLPTGILYGGPSVPLQVTNCIILRTLRKIPKGFFNFRCTFPRNVRPTGRYYSKMYDILCVDNL